MDFSVGIKKYPLNVFAFLEENGEQFIQKFCFHSSFKQQTIEKIQL
jgi:hypothetical protein